MEENPSGGGTPKEGSAANRLTIKVSDENASGSYANFAMVHLNELEFVLDFVFVEPQRPLGQVVSRVIANPKTVKRLLVGLTEMVRRYEERYGDIPSPESGSPQGTYH